jgi:hypothetical protein
VDRHKQAQAIIAARTSSEVLAIWDALGSIDRAEVAGFLEAVAPYLAAAKKATITLATGFYSTILQTRPPAIAVDAIDVDFAGRTPFTATWHALGEGRPYAEAIEAGRSIADAQVHRYVTSAGRRTGDAVATATRHRVRWRRVPSTKACPFCVNAAGQLYHSAESADFGHDRCGCAAVPAA